MFGVVPPKSASSTSEWAKRNAGDSAWPRSEPSPTGAPEAAAAASSSPYRPRERFYRHHSHPHSLRRAGEGRGRVCEPMSGSPPALFFQKVRCFVQRHTPESLRSLNFFGCCGNFFTRNVDVGLEGYERHSARTNAALAVHLAAAILLLEAGHALHLGYCVHTRAARAESRRPRRRAQESGEGGDARPAMTASASASGGTGVCSGSWTRVGSSTAVSASGGTAATPSPESDGTEEGKPRAAEPRAASVEEEDAEGDGVAGRLSAVPPSATSARRGHRLVSYWGLIEAAVLAGKRKAPSPPVAIDAILARTAAASVCAPNGAAAINGSNPIASGDTFLVLPEAFSFSVSPLAHRLVATPSADVAASDGGSKDIARADDAAQDSARTPWLTLYLLWTDAVRYTVNTDEIRKLLLAYPVEFYTSLAADATAAASNEEEEGGEAPAGIAGAHAALSRAGRGVAHPRGSSPRSSAPPCLALREAVASLALAWRLTLARRVYDALVVHEDTQRCADDVEELTLHEGEIYRRCIAPWEAAARAKRGTSSSASAATTSVSGAPSPDATAPLIVCSPPRAWLHLSLVLQQLRRLSRRLTIHSVGSLFRYMYASSKSKYISGAMLAVLTAVSSRVTSAGMRAREAVTQVLGGFYYSGGCHTSDAAHEPTSPRAARLFAAQMLSLSSFELIRLTVNTVLLKTSQQFISVAASQRRDAVKAQLYGALTHMPLSFFDLHSYDEIEEMVYYVNDLEGVDVHVHQYAFTTVTTFAAMRLALAPLSKEARLLVLGTVAASYTVQWVGTAVAKGYGRLRQRYVNILRDGDGGSHPSVTAAVLGSFMGVCAEPDTAANALDLEQHQQQQQEPQEALQPSSSGYPPLASTSVGGDTPGGDKDAQEAENISSANSRDGIMLRGLEIVAALPQLRPYGADVSLMAWWNAYVAHKTGGGAKSGGGGGVLAMLLRDTHGQLLPALGNATLKFVDWFLPLFTSVYGAHTAARCQDAGPATASGRLLDATNAVKAAVEAARDACRVLDVVLSNSYKACVIERILNPRFWESTASEDIERVYTYASALSWDDAAVKPPPVALYRRLTHQHADTLRAATAAAHSKATYENLMVTRVVVRGLQFAYPSNPTVPVFAQPFNAEMLLQDPHTGKGRLVCITGPSGQGKSTMLYLLLGLYTNYGSASGNEPDAEGPATGLSFSCFTSPIQVRLAYKSGLRTPIASEDASDPSTPLRVPATAGVVKEERAAGDAAAEEYTVSLREIPCGVLRGQLFSYVPQYPTLFAGATIAHNISLSPFISLEETALLARVQACADDAKCDYIRRFPQGLLTPVGDASSLWSGTSAADGGGLVRLSGGQAQRLMVARALYHGGSILLMDEPTASLDAATKAELLKEWRQLLNRGVIKGIICATHDEVVMAAADEVISLAQD